MRAVDRELTDLLVRLRLDKRLEESVHVRERQVALRGEVADELRVVVLVAVRDVLELLDDWGRTENRDFRAGGEDLLDDLRVLRLELGEGHALVLAAVRRIVHAVGEDHPVGLLREDVLLEPREHLPAAVAAHAREDGLHVDAAVLQRLEDDVDVAPRLLRPHLRDRVSQERDRVAALDQRRLLLVFRHGVVEVLDGAVGTNLELVVELALLVPVPAREDELVGRDVQRQGLALVEDDLAVVVLVGDVHLALRRVRHSLEDEAVRVVAHVTVLVSAHHEMDAPLVRRVVEELVEVLADDAVVSVIVRAVVAHHDAELRLLPLVRLLQLAEPRDLLLQIGLVLLARGGRVVPLAVRVEDHVEDWALRDSVVVAGVGAGEEALPLAELAPVQVMVAAHEDGRLGVSPEPADVVHEAEGDVVERIAAEAVLDVVAEEEVEVGRRRAGALVHRIEHKARGAVEVGGEPRAVAVALRVERPERVDLASDRDLGVGRLETVHRVDEAVLVFGSRLQALEEEDVHVVRIVDETVARIPLADELLRALLAILDRSAAHDARDEADRHRVVAGVRQPRTVHRPREVHLPAHVRPGVGVLHRHGVELPVLVVLDAVSVQGERRARQRRRKSADQGLLHLPSSS